MDYKVVLTVTAIVVGFIGYLPYFRDLYRGTTKPHVFSWFAWTLLTGIAFFAQLSEGAGPGAWVTGFSTLLTLSVTIVALFNGEKEITRIDWVCFIGAILGIIFWRITNNPLFAVILVTLADFLGFMPTFRKAYYRPNEETAVMYGLSGLKFALSLPALRSFTLTTWLYPVSLILTNGIMVLIVVVRRKILSAGKTPLTEL